MFRTKNASKLDAKSLPVVDKTNKCCLRKIYMLLGFNTNDGLCFAFDSWNLGGGSFFSSFFLVFLRFPF